MPQQMPPAPDFRYMETGEVAKYQDIYPEAIAELQRRMSGRPDPLPGMSMPQYPPSQMQALQQEQPQVTREAGPTGMEQFMQQVGPLLESIGQTGMPAPGQINRGPSQQPTGLEAMAASHDRVSKNPMYVPFPGTGPEGAGAAPGSFRAAQDEGMSPSFMEKAGAAIAKINTASEQSAKPKEQPQGGAQVPPGGVPVPGPNPGAPAPGGPPPMPQGGAQVPPGGVPVPPPNPGAGLGAPGTALPPGVSGQPKPGASPGEQNFLSAMNNMSPEQSDMLLRFGLSLMKNSGPQPGQTRTTGLGAAIGRAGVETLDVKDKKDLAKSRQEAISAEKKLDRAVRREGNEIQRERLMSDVAYKNRKLIMDGDSKALDRRIRQAKLSIDKQKAATDLRDSYREAADDPLMTDDRFIGLMQERNAQLNALGVKTGVIRTATDKDGNKKIYEIDPDTGKPIEIR